MDDSQQDPGPTTDEPAATIDADVIVPASPLRIVPGDRIGPFKVLELLGEGGFGAVYLCDQKEPVRRKVAVKIIKAGMDTAEVVSRFEAERQAMAMMSHPAIAKVFEAGATPEGRPYFVMEYVKGVPITEYCDAHRLGINARLELFERVCHAVQHAHHKGIIHRDIKPGNVLVSIDGSREPLPKIIDFGIAKAISQQLTEETIHTQAGQMMGTLLYMSPEQAGLSTEDIDTRSDVYSLGVVLYQLISGRLPFEAELLREKGYFEMQRVIREEDPPRPSTHIATSARGADEETTRIAKERQTSIGELANTLRRELEWIPLKALRKDRSERYSSAEALADDVHRYLVGEALEAGPESTLYRVRKLMRRHRGPVTAAALVSLTLIAGIFGTTKFALDAKEQARLAEQAAARAKATSEFLASILGSIDPATARTRDTELLEEVLLAAATRVDREFASHPQIEADLRTSISAGHEAIFQFEEARMQLDKVHSIQARTLGIDDPDTLATQLDLGRVLEKMGHGQEALELWEDAAERLAATQGDDFVLTLLANSYRSSGLIGMGRVDEGIELRRNKVQLFEQSLGPEAAETREARIDLAHGLDLGGRQAEAAEIFREHWRWLTSTKGESDLETLQIQRAWISCLVGTDREEEALEAYQDLLPLLEDALAEDHPDVGLCRFQMGNILSNLGRHQEALDSIEPTLKLHLELYGPHHAGSLACARIQFASLHELGELEAAAEVGEACLEHHLKAPLYGPSASHTAAVAGRLGAVYESLAKGSSKPEFHAKAKKYGALHRDLQQEFGDQEKD